MLEYHVDSHSIFRERFNRLPYSFGGNISVRKESNLRKLSILGQDESIYKQFKFTKSRWCLPNGEFTMVPQDEGQGIMVSAFVSCELGFGLSQEKFEENLQIINEKRSRQHG